MTRSSPAVLQLTETLARHGLGFARIAPDGAVLDARGAGVDWLPTGANVFDTPVLAGFQSDFDALRAGAAARIALPTLALMSGARFGVSVVWRDDQRVIVRTVGEPSAGGLLLLRCVTGGSIVHALFDDDARNGEQGNGDVRHGPFPPEGPAAAPRARVGVRAGLG